MHLISCPAYSCQKMSLSEESGQTSSVGNIQSQSVQQMQEVSCKNLTCRFLVQSVVLLGKLIYYPAHFIALFWVLEAAATTSAVVINILLQLVINSALPLLLPEKDIHDGIVITGSVLFLLAILLPLLSLIPSVFHLAVDVWSLDQLPTTRLMIFYLRRGLPAVMDYKVCGRGRDWQNMLSWRKIPWVEVVIMIFKSVLVFGTLLASWIYGKSRILEVFFRLGWYYGLIMFGCWIILSFCLQVIAKHRRQVKFPSMNLFGVVFQREDGHINYSQHLIFWKRVRAKCRPVCKIFIYLFMISHWITSLVVGSYTASELDLSIGTTVASLLIMTFGIAFSYYMMFSTNKPPSECCNIHLNQRENLRLLGLDYPTPRDLARNCIAFIGLLLVLALVLTATTQFSEDLKKDNSCRSRRSVLNSVELGHSSSTLYELCSHHWFDLTIVDLAILADLAYFELNSEGILVECDDMKVNYQSLDQTFPEWQWEVRGQDDENDQVKFYELYSRTRNLTVLTVRGTRFSSTQDLLQDVDLYTEVACLQFFSLFVPLTTVLPLDTIADIVYYSSFLERVIYHTGRYYYTAMNNYVKEHSPGWGDRVVITGHSLGGAVGKISGSHYGIRSFAFNSPGLLFSHRKFGLELDKINQAVVNIVAKFDIVSEVDKLGGSSNRIGCSSDSIVECHRMGNMICDLKRYCQVNSIAAQIAC